MVWKADNEIYPMTILDLGLKNKMINLKCRFGLGFRISKDDFDFDFQNLVKSTFS